MNRLLHEPTLRAARAPPRTAGTAACRSCASCSGSRTCSPPPRTSRRRRAPRSARSGALSALRIGTRGSALALAQARLGRRARSAAGRARGDHDARATAQRGVGDKARWVKELERALLAGEIDLAVH